MKLYIRLGLELAYSSSLCVNTSKEIINYIFNLMIKDGVSLKRQSFVVNSLSNLNLDMIVYQAYEDFY